MIILLIIPNKKCEIKYFKAFLAQPDHAHHVEFQNRKSTHPTVHWEGGGRHVGACITIDISTV